MCYDYLKQYIEYSATYWCGSTSALVLIDCNFSFVPAVENQIKEIEGVEFLYEISDTYKIILKLGAASKEELKDKVTDIIHLQNVRNTLSLIILRWPVG